MYCGFQSALTSPILCYRVYLSGLLAPRHSVQLRCTVRAKDWTSRSTTLIACALWFLASLFTALSFVCVCFRVLMLYSV
jgi:hypothetical protein